MGVWQRSEIGRKVAQEHPTLQSEYRLALPDYTSADVISSPYAIHSYQVDQSLGGNQQLDELRQRMQQHKLRLILDFVPNHFAKDHNWLIEHPERFIQGTLDNLLQDPLNYFATEDGQVFAHGKDPHFDGWSDTVQLDYRQPGTRQAMSELLLEVASLCDGVRCDMAMLLVNDIFLRTWGGSSHPLEDEFWPLAIRNIKARHSDFIMIAEVYWGLESKLLKMGFDFTYDKEIYDYLLDMQAKKVRAHLSTNLKYQFHLVRFIENHDEKRAVEAFGDPQRSLAVATLALCLPGMRLFHEGQLQGCRLKLPVQLRRRHPEPIDTHMEEFYQRLLTALRDPVFHDGEWRLLKPRIQVTKKSVHNDLVAYQWVLGENYRIVVVNLSPNSTQCILPLEIFGLEGHSWQLHDLLNDLVYISDGEDLSSRGLCFDILAYGYHMFKLDGQSAIEEGKCITQIPSDKGTPIKS